MGNENYSKKTFIISSVITAFLCVGIGVGSGVLIGKAIFEPTAEEQKLIGEYRMLKDDWLYGNEVDYLNDLASSGLISGVAQSIGDDFTFYTKTEGEQGLATDGNGFGFSSHPYDGGLYVTDVCNVSTANNAGLKTGDVLYSVTIGTEVFNFKEHTDNEITAKLSSISDTTTKFTFEGKRGSENITKTMTRGNYVRDLVTVTQVPDTSNNNTMVVKVNTFLGNPTSALQGVIASYENNIDHLVFDMRGNGGGYLNQAANMAQLFVKKETMIYDMVDKNGKSKDSLYQKNDPIYQFQDYSLILDGYSASATEVFALAMRAGTNCKVYGFKSYGKGVAQEFKVFSDGSVVRYTSAYIYGPERENETMYDEGEDEDKRICIHGKGIIPDVIYEDDFQFLNPVADFASALGVPEVIQNHFLKVLNYLYPSDYPKNYGRDFHFWDAVYEYAQYLSSEYSIPSLTIPYEEDGTIKKEINDKFTKESFDKYLSQYDKLYNYVLEQL